MKKFELYEVKDNKIIRKNPEHNHPPFKNFNDKLAVFTANLIYYWDKNKISIFRSSK